jgi:hypothetical protein
MTSEAFGPAHARVARLSMIAGAALLFVAWALMPDAATADAAHILDAVGPVRARVALSAAIQLVASALLAPGVACVARAGGRGAPWSAVALAIGAMGMAADAVYHQLAAEMTAPGIDRAAALPVMVAMQTVDLRTLAPLLLAFVVGVPAVAFTLPKDLPAVRAARVLVFVALAVIVVGGGAAGAGIVPRRFVALGTLAALCGSLASVGAAIPFR